MKNLLLLALSALLLSPAAYAGSLGGPAPFRNGSPISTGTDGTYNAAFRGQNLSGIFRFSIQEGSQTGGIVLPSISGPRPDPSQANAYTVTVATYSSRFNTWVAWYEGIAYRGLTDAAITQGTVSGVLAVQISPSTDLPQPGRFAPVAFSNFLPSIYSSIVNGTALVVQDGNPPVTTIFSTAANRTVSINAALSAPQTWGAPLAINSVLQSGEFHGILVQKSPYGEIKGKGRFAVVRDGGLDPNRPAGALSSLDATIYASDITRAANNPRYRSEYVDFTWKGARVQSANPNLTFARF
ncbi:MAG: hypothetical protein N2035_00810 [Chthoniobacterales bacterium]|nr:hypothetical protein [Chthoniobacterales bacterium]